MVICEERRVNCPPHPLYLVKGDSYLIAAKSYCPTKRRGPLDMPNAIPLASVLILLGEDSHPDSHSIGGVFELKLGVCVQ